MTPLKFTGDEPASTERIETGWFSFDHALEDNQGHVGFPLRSLVELYGQKSVGKTTFALSLMGKIASEKNKGCTILDLEIQERSTVEDVLTNQGFSGEVFYIIPQSKDKKETTEDAAGRFTSRFISKNPDIGLLDSIEGYRPSAEEQGDIGDRNVGQKPLEIGQISGRLLRSLQITDSPHTIFMTNHEHPKIGYMQFGSTPTGGVTKKALCTVRFGLSHAYIKLGKEKTKTPVNFESSWLMQGHIENNRHGFSGKKFYVYMVGGEGVHTGLTAMWDCILYGYADLSSKAVKESTTVTMDGVPYGKLGTIIRDRNSEPERFNQFINVLKSQGLQSTETEERDEE